MELKGDQIKYFSVLVEVFSPSRFLDDSLSLCRSPCQVDKTKCHPHSSDRSF